MSKPFKIVAVLDRRAQSFSGLMPVSSLDVGKRMYADLLTHGGDVVSRHPEDFDLYALGEIDLDTGKIDGYAVPEFVCNNLEVNENGREI